MTPIKRLLRNFAQKMTNVYYDGPEPPARLLDAVRHFAGCIRTQAEWKQFAATHACEAYRTGYVRGLEWSERDLDRRDPETDVELVIANSQHSWGLDIPAQEPDDVN